MLLVDASVGRSSIHGLGLIARENVPAGAATSRFEPRLDVELTQAELDALPGTARRTFRYYSFRHIHSRNYVLSFDDDRFTNHCDDPNTDGRHALRAIERGEEITYDYRRWDLDCEWKLASTPASFDRTLETGNRDARLAVLRVITEVGLEDTRVVPRVAEQLRDADRELRYYAAKSLARIGGPAAAPAAAELASALRDSEPGVRYYAAKCLSRVAPGTGSAVVEDLVRGLADGEVKVRYYCAKALGAMGSGAKTAAIPLRAVLLDESEPQVRDAANRALGRIESAL